MAPARTPRILTLRPHPATLALLLPLAFGGPARAQAPRIVPEVPVAEVEVNTREAVVRSDIERELSVQGDLLAKIERDSDEEVIVADELPEYGLVDDADPRGAPPAPTDREIPAAVFEVEEVVVPAKTWGNRSKLRLRKLVLDADLDSKPELVRWIDPESDLMVRQEQDRNYDGVTDSWSEYEWGVPVARVLDSNDDGNPDVWERYGSGRMTEREIDRDDDGVRDAFYRYQGDSLVEERHDANNDGAIDLVIFYENRHRVRSEEDQDKNGQIDTWTSYGVVEGAELVSRIDRDKRGRGFPDTFEIFEPKDGKALLSRREEDIDGDGETDVISIYRDGKLTRREITNPDVVPL